MAVKTYSKFIPFFIISNLLTIKSSFLNIEELQKSKYVVEISREPVLLSNQDDGTMHLTSKYGQQYQCLLPLLNVDEERDALKNITTQEIVNILQPLNNTCLYSPHGWWTYRTCFGRSVHQYHDDGTQPVKDDLCLGNFSGQTDWSTVNTEEKPTGKVWYHSQFYTNGTICDLTGSPRNTEIQFFCKEGATDIIERINEPSTCNYVISVHTNKLCNLSLFRPKESPKELSINCSPALLEDQYLKYKEMKEQSNKEDIDVEDVGNMLTPRTDENTEEAGPMTSNIFKKIGKLLSQDKQESGDEIDWGDGLKESTANSDEETLSSEESVTEAREIENVIEDEKERNDGGDKYYEDLIEELKGQYRTFKQEMVNMAKDVRKRVENFERSSDVNPIMAKIVGHLRQTVQKFEEKQKALDIEMEKLTDFNKAVMEGRDPALLRTEMTNMRKRLYNLMKKMNQKDHEVDDSSEADDNDESNAESDGVPQKNNIDQNEKYVDTGQTRTTKLDQERKQESIFNKEHDKNIVKENKELGGSVTKKEHKVFDMENPKLDKVVSKLKKLMTQDAEKMTDDNNEDTFYDDHVSVRVVKVKDKNVLEQTDESMFDEGDEDDRMQESEEMRSATKKMESIVRKQLQEAGIKHEGNVKVKIITSSDYLKKVTSNGNGFQILSSDETNEFKTLLTSLLGSTSDFVKEREKQEKLEANYNLVWNQGSFMSAKDDHSNDDVEKEDEKEQIFSF